MQLLESETCPGSATFNPGSICNLACVTCASSASTRWQHELGIPIVQGNPKEIDHDMINRANQMQGIVIGGGEPVLNLSTKTLLSQLNHDVLVSVHFNGTVMPDKLFLEMSARFDTINFVFSLDGTQDRFEYLRWPGKWNVVTKNIKKMYSTVPDNVGFGVNITLSQLNKHYYQEIVEWVNSEIPYNRTGKSTHISYNHAGDILNQQYLDGLDLRRGTNWRAQFPLAVKDIPYTLNQPRY
jgi:MoaA/NifB/PqqE/SkfB family radical SAM enzyme